MKYALAAGCLALVLARPSRAQSTPGDSAAWALRSYRAALESYRAGDIGSARTAMSSAARSWPGQTAYHVATALFAAQQGDAAGLIASVAQLVRAEAGAQIASDSAVMRMSLVPAVRDALQQLRDATGAVAASMVFATLADSTLFPEGMDVDRQTGHAYVASVRHRTIVERRADGGERELLPRDHPGLGAIFGVRVDPQGNRLWATTSGSALSDRYVPGDTAIAALLEIRISDGAILHRWDTPPAPGGSLLGDLAVADNGNVFVTDSRNPALYRLDRATGSLVRHSHPLFRSLQGVTVPPDGGVVYLADYSHGLLRLDLRTGAVHVVQHDAGASTLGLDGIAYYEGSIIAVQNGVTPARVARYTLDVTGTRITAVRTIDRNLALADEPTIGAIVGDAFVYVANSAWEKYDGTGRRVPGRPLTRPVLLRVPLR